MADVGLSPVLYVTNYVHPSDSSPHSIMVQYVSKMAVGLSEATGVQLWLMIYEG